MKQVGVNNDSYGKGRWQQDLKRSFLVFALWLAFPLGAWPQGGHREAVLVIGDAARSLAVQGDGKLVAAGQSDKGFAVARYNSDGTLDLGFGMSGKVITDFGDVGGGASALSVQKDGKLVAAGIAYTRSIGATLPPPPPPPPYLLPQPALMTNNFTLVRYNADGSVDLSFGTDGTVTTDFSRDYDEAFALVIQPDDKLVVAGMLMSGFNLVRYNPDGTLDPSFGVGGGVRTETTGHAVAMQPDGKIIIAGPKEGGFFMARYEANGNADPHFGLGGIVTTAFDAMRAVPYALALQPDGKQVVTGVAFDDQDCRFTLVRYNLDGNLDTNFGSGGKVTTAIGARSDEVHPFGPQYTHKSACRVCDVAIQPDGKIVVAGSSLRGGTFDFALVRYNPDGSLDPSFGNEGKVITAIGKGEDYAYGLAVQPDGKVVVAGSTQVSSRESNFALVRYNPDGSLDTSFGREGVVITRIGKGYIVS